MQADSLVAVDFLAAGFLEQGCFSLTGTSGSCSDRQGSKSAAATRHSEKSFSREEFHSLMRDASHASIPRIIENKESFSSLSKYQLVCKRNEYWRVSLFCNRFIPYEQKRAEWYSSHSQLCISVTIAS